jgi:hypothetical protein
MNNLITYKPLTEAITYDREKLYKSCTKEEFTRIRAENESIYFDVSGAYVASNQIKKWEDADPEDVVIAWETKGMTTSQKRIFESSKRAFLEYFGGTKPLTTDLLVKFIHLAKRNEVAQFGR